VIDNGIVSRPWLGVDDERARGQTLASAAAHGVTGRQGRGGPL
jgi:hypothetical protein